jgi:hypothetical protein
MPIVKVWCLPEHQTEADLNKLHQAIVLAIIGVKKLGIKNQNDIACLFPPDLMKYGLGDEIIVEIELPHKPRYADLILQHLAKSLGESVHILYPKAKVECLVEVFNPARGFWTSAK